VTILRQQLFASETPGQDEDEETNVATIRDLRVESPGMTARRLWQRLQELEQENARLLRSLASPGEPTVQARCVACNHGVSVRNPPAECPVCGSDTWDFQPWRPFTADSGTDHLPAA
jgi:rubrerythrin